MSKKTKTPKAKNSNKSKASKGAQLRIAGTERPNRIPEVDKQAEKYRKTRNAWQELGKTMGAEKAKLIAIAKEHKLTESYFYDDDEGDTEEVKPIAATKEDIKVNKVKQAKAKSDE